MKEWILFRLNSSSQDKKGDQSEPTIDISIPPQTPILQTGVFESFEPPASPRTSQFTVPTSDPIWNNVVEYQLSDGKKVFR